MDILGGILIGIGSGIAYAITGYLKSLKENGNYEPFDSYKFLQSTIVGGIAGGLSVSLGWTLEASYQFVFNTGLTALIENVKKFIWRKYLKNWFSS
jgi:hypothetical protein